MKTPIIPVNLTMVSSIVFQPEDDEPAILFLYTNGERYLCVFGDDAECGNMRAHIESELRNENFIRYHSLFFRAEDLLALTKCESVDRCHYIHFAFNNGFEYWQTYDDEQQLDTDLNVITDILATLQDIRASKRTSPTKQ
jgi:hypothetical protein